MLENKIKLMIENSNEMNKVKGTLGESTLKKCGALNLTLKNIHANANEINECRNIIKRNTSIFSNFRGYNLLNSSIELSLIPSPQQSIKEIITIYEKLKQHFFQSSFLVLAAQIIYDAKDRINIDEAISNTKKAYDHMKKNHFFLTSSEDLSAAAMIAVTSNDLEKDCDELEACYKILKSKIFFGGNNLQALSHTLALFKGTPEEKCEKVIKLNQALKNYHIPLKSYALPILGVCAFITDDYNSLAKDIAKTNDILKKQYGFGALSIGYTMRSMIAASLVASTYIEENNDDKLINITKNATLNIAIIMLIAASTSASCAAAAAASASPS